MNEFDEQTSHVSKILHDTSAQFDVPTVGLAAVRRRGSTRQHRRRAYAATASVVVLLGTGVLVVQRLSSSPKRTIAPASEDSSVSQSTQTPLPPVVTSPGGPMPTPGASGEPVQRVDSAFVWNAITLGSAEAVSNLVFGIAPTKEAPYLAWSTAPGPTTNGVYQPVMYRSDDGVGGAAPSGSS